MPYTLSFGSPTFAQLEMTFPPPVRWLGGGDLYSGGANTGEGGFSELFLGVETPDKVHPDVCNPSLERDVGSTVDEFVLAMQEALATLPRTTVSDPVDTTLGELPAERLTVVAAPEPGSIIACDSGTKPSLWTLPSGNSGWIVAGTYGLYAQDVHGRRVVCIVHYDPANPDQARSIAGLLKYLSWK